MPANVGDGIRTHEPFRVPVFKTGAIGRSATPTRGAVLYCAAPSSDPSQGSGRACQPSLLSHSAERGNTGSVLPIGVPFHSHIRRHIRHCPRHGWCVPGIAWPVSTPQVTVTYPPAEFWLFSTRCIRLDPERSRAPRYPS